MASLTAPPSGSVTVPVIVADCPSAVAAVATNTMARKDAWTEFFIPAGSLRAIPAGVSPSHVLVEVIHRALPGELGRGFVVTRRGVVMEAVVGSVVDERLVVALVGLESCLVGRPSGVDTRIQAGVVRQNRSLDLGGLLGAVLRAVERNRSRQIGA